MSDRTSDEDFGLLWTLNNKPFYLRRNFFSILLSMKICRFPYFILLSL